MISITKGKKTEIKRCLVIARSLPRHFTPKMLHSIRKDLANHSFHVAKDDSGNILGFASVSRINKKVMEIRWLAVSKEYQRQGIGSAILVSISKHFKSKGIKGILAKTLSERVRYKPYNASRGFLEKAGFILLETIDPYPNWDPGNPCAIYGLFL